MALSRRTGQRFQASIWPGFVDAMTGLLLVLMFVLTIFMVVQFVLRETITGQESELNQLSGEVAKLAEALGLEKSRTNDLDSRLTFLNSTLKDAQLRIESQTAEIAALTSERDERTADLATAKIEISSFEAQVAALIIQREGALTNIAILEDEQSRLISEKEALNLALSKVRDEVDIQVQEARLAAARTEALQALIDDLGKQNSEMVDDPAKLKVNLEATQEALNVKEIALLAESAAAEALRTRLKNANAELTAMTLTLEAQRQEAEVTLTLLAAARAAEQDLDSQLMAALLAINMADNTAASTQAQMLDIEAELVSALTSLEAVKSENGNLKTERVALEEHLAALLLSSESNAATMIDLEAQLSLVLAELDATRTVSSTLEARVLAAEDALDGRTVKTEELQAELTTARQDLSARIGEVDDLKVMLENARNERSTSNIEVENLQTRLTTIEARLRVSDLAMGEIRNRLAAALAAKVTAESQLSAQQTGLDSLKIELAKAIAERDLAQADNASVDRTNEDVRAQLVAALAAKLAAENELNALSMDTMDARAQLANALAEKYAADNLIIEQNTKAKRNEVLLAEAQKVLAAKEATTFEAQRQTELLNQQVSVLREQLGQLQILLDDATERDETREVQLQSLGSDLNTALARVAAEERRRRELEEAQRLRIEKDALQQKALQQAERLRLEAEAKDLEKYRSEFFGRLRDVLGRQEGVRIVGDRFVFSSEVLFPPGDAELSDLGAKEITKVADILMNVVDDIPPEIDWVIQVDGHTDNVSFSGTGPFADNWELSQGRALSVVKFMINSLGIPPNHLSANGFGQYQPLNSADTPEARAQNRRIELKFTEK